MQMDDYIEKEGHSRVADVKIPKMLNKTDARAQNCKFKRFGPRLSYQPEISRLLGSDS